MARLLHSFGPNVLVARFAGLLGRPRVTVSLRGPGKVTLRPHDSDLLTFQQVFEAGEYDISAFPQGGRLRRFYDRKLERGAVPIIIDAGANVGAAAIWFAQQFPDSAIYAIEPDKDNVELCQHNCARFGNIIVVEGAIGGRPGAASVHRDGYSWAVQTRRADDGAGVQILSVADILDRAGDRAKLFIVKVDIEGFEADLFAHNTAWIDDADAIFVEPHDWLFPAGKTSQPMQAALAGREFEIVVRCETLVFIRDDADDTPSDAAEASTATAAMRSGAALH